MAEHYGGMKELLYRLADSGRKTAVATLKRQDLAVKILTEFGLAGAFGVIYGMDENDMLTKSSLICRCVDYFSVRAEEAVLIGDSMNDAVGAQNAGVAFIGVTYGLGFAAGDGNEISAAGGAVARSVGELCGLLFT
jgi:phosphoglycolate phosphatase